ncbi:Imm51 family immunity protein [Pontibacter ruber]|uniref:Imm51 family immunity protein n=1 Tax=Pontibacter ruber TaxID=1343895 RepID=A0ABW5CU26_9BACT|nr:Imm51 family immunity protein [Pontibacter ruber]
MKLLYTFLFLILMSCSGNGQTAKNDKLVKALNNSTLETRGKLVEISPNEYRLDYYDVHEEDSHFEYLSEKGYQGGGPSWLGIIYGAIQMSDPAIHSEISFDDEAEGLAIWSSDKESLEKIGRLIYVVKSDENIMMEAIKVAEQAGEME